MASPINVLIFGSSNHMNWAKKALGSRYSVQPISTEQLDSEPFEVGAACVVMSDFPSNFPVGVRQKIHQFVRGGGKLIGIGLGSAIAAQRLVSSNTSDFSSFLFSGSLEFHPSSNLIPIKFNSKEWAFPLKSTSISLLLDSNSHFNLQDLNCKIMGLNQNSEKICMIQLTHGTGRAFLSCGIPEETIGAEFFKMAFQQLGLNPEENQEVVLTPILFSAPSLQPIKKILAEKYEWSSKNSPFSIKFVDSISNQLVEKDLILIEMTDKPIKRPDLSFDFEKYQSSLSSTSMGRHLMFSEVVTSTQQILQDFFMPFHQMPSGLVFTTRFQTAGRGRSSNSWVSPNGCLMFSLHLRFDDMSRVLFLQYLMALAIVRAIKSFPALSKLPVGIKWPNDIYYDSTHKLGGILVNSSSMGTANYHLIGTGFNLDNSLPTICLNDMIEKNYGTQHRICSETLLARFLNQFEEIFEVFCSKGFAPLESLYLENWLHTNQKVVYLDSQKGELKAIVEGLTPSGFLKVKDLSSNSSIELHPDGNSFDMFHGLIKSKNL